MSLLQFCNQWKMTGGFWTSFAVLFGATRHTGITHFPFNTGISCAGLFWKSNIQYKPLFKSLGLFVSLLFSCVCF